MSPSCRNSQSRLSSSDILFNSKTHESIVPSVYEEKMTNLKQEEIEQDKDCLTNEEQFDEIHLTNEEEEQVEYLVQFLRNGSPIDLAIDNGIMPELNDILDTKTNENDNNQISNEFQTSSSSVIMRTYPYPPLNQTGKIIDHDRPYAKYRYFNRQTIAKLSQFNLRPPSSSSLQQPIRLNLKSFAILSWTTVSKDAVMNYIKREFPIKNIQYICVGEGISRIAAHQQQLEIQIILKKKVNKRTRFLDRLTETYCNYKVTTNDLAWNEYIKKNLNFIEYNRFKSTKVRGNKHWPPLPLSTAAVVAEAAAAAIAISKVAAKAAAKAAGKAATAKIAAKVAAEAVAKVAATSSLSTSFDQNQTSILREKTSTGTQTEERWQHQNEEAKRALELVQTGLISSDKPMHHIHPYK
ncbi:unnamed protein product [Rotaria sp. Silwood2]|nr:unnamed protein product [Rotaria sp. Silwood2]CAF4279948.1 unnamed protein product [Rotaria sp. Silwood2]